jgi:hypothetical protein
MSKNVTLMESDGLRQIMWGSVKYWSLGSSFGPTVVAVVMWRTVVVDFSELSIKKEKKMYLGLETRLEPRPLLTLPLLLVLLVLMLLVLVLVLLLVLL